MVLSWMPEQTDIVHCSLNFFTLIYILKHSRYCRWRASLKRATPLRYRVWLWMIQATG